MLKKIFVSPLFSPVVYSVLWGIVLFVVLVFFPEQKFAITEDGAIIEYVTHLGYVLMIAAFFVYLKDFKGSRQSLLSWGVFLFLGVCAFLREAGIQHHLSKTDSTPFKSRFFLNENNPLSEKIIFGLVLLVVFGAMVYVAVKYTKHLVTSFFKLNTVTWSIATLCTVLVFAKFADRFPANYRHSHEIPLARGTIDLCSLLEESSEMFLPYLVVIILAQYHLLKNKDSH